MRQRLLACRLPALARGPEARVCGDTCREAVRPRSHGPAEGPARAAAESPRRAEPPRARLRVCGCTRVCVCACLCVTVLLCLRVRGCAHVFVFVVASVCLTVCLCVCVCLRLCVRGWGCLFLQRQTRRHSPASGDPQVAGTSPPGHCPPPAVTPRGSVAPGWLSWLLYSQQGQAGVCRSCVCDVPFLLSLVSWSTAPRSQSGLVRPVGSPCPEVWSGPRRAATGTSLRAGAGRPGAAWCRRAGRRLLARGPGRGAGWRPERRRVCPRREHVTATPPLVARTDPGRAEGDGREEVQGRRAAPRKVTDGAVAGTCARGLAVRPSL